jgi:predicted nucleic acid-binding protein
MQSGAVDGATPWLQTVAVLSVVSDLPDVLGRGEREAITLARQRGAMLLIDDLPGRKEAKRRGVQISGTLAAVAGAASVKRLDLRKELLRLKQLGFRLSSDLESRVLSDHGYTREQT